MLERLSWLAVARGRVVGATIADDSPATVEAFREWAADPEVTEIVRMPCAAARQFFGEAWPGRGEALAALVRASAVATDV